jgi:hypothetical protein
LGAKEGPDYPKETAMTCNFYRYTFTEGTSLTEVENSLFLAVFSAEGLHGRAQVRLYAGYFLDEKRRACVVDAATAVGKTIAQIFTGLLGREFGDDAFTVERVVGAPLAAADMLVGGSP